MLPSVIEQDHMVDSTPSGVPSDTPVDSFSLLVNQRKVSGPIARYEGFFVE